MITRADIIKDLHDWKNDKMGLNALMDAVDRYSSASNNGSGSLPPDLRYISKLLPVAKRELEAAAETIGHEPVVLNRLVQKLEEYLAAMTV